MSVTVDFPIDPMTLDELRDAGWTTIQLWYSNTPDGSYANSSATVSPTTLALMSSGEDYVATFTYSSGNRAQWFKVRAYDGANYSDLPNSRPFHGGGGTTLTYLRQLVGRELQIMETGTLTTSSNTTTGIFPATDASIARRADDYFNGQYWFNTTRGLWVSVTDWVQSTRTATVPTVAAQATTDSIEIWQRFTPDEIRHALNWAITAAYPHLFTRVVNTSVLTAQDIYQYDVPADIFSVHSVEIESEQFITSTVAATRGHPWEQTPYAIIKDGLSQKIEFKRQYNPERRLRIQGTGLLSRLYNETDFVETIEPRLDLLVYLAAFRLYRSLPNTAASSDIDRYTALADHYWARAEKARGNLGEPRPAKQMWSASAQQGFVVRAPGSGSFSRTSGMVS